MNRKHLLIAAVLAILMKIFAISSANADPSCFDAVQLALLGKVKKKLTMKFDSQQDPGMIRANLRQLRNGVRDRLQVWQGHSFPWDEESTSLKAYSQIHDAYSPPLEGTPDALGIAQFREENLKILDSVENYQSELASRIAEEETKAVQIQVLKDYLKNIPEEKKFGYTVKLPVISPESEDVTFVERYFPSKVAIEIRAKELKKQVDNSLGKGWFKKTAINNRAYQQAKYLSRLDTLRDWILIHEKKHPDKPMPAELQELLTRIKSFYTDETFMHVKDDYKPPYWAWNNVRWNELWHEVKALYVQQLPKVGKNQAIKDVVDFVKGLTPEDQRVLGVDNLGYSVGFASRAKWIRLVGTSIVGFSGMTGALSAVYDALISDARERENCAEKPSDDEFLTCLNDHINVKFAIHYLLRGKTVDDITDENGKITNPKVASEIRYAVDQRNSFLLKKIARDSNDEAIQEKARQTLFNGDSYRLELVMADDKDFKRMVLGDSKTPSYLQVRFPKVFSQNKETLKKILDLKFASKEQNHLIMELCGSSPTMAEEVKLLLDRRKNPNDPTSSFVLLDPKGICLEDLSEAAAASDSK